LCSWAAAAAAAVAEVSLIFPLLPLIRLPAISLTGAEARDTRPLPTLLPWREQEAFLAVQGPRREAYRQSLPAEYPVRAAEEAVQLQYQEQPNPGPVRSLFPDPEAGAEALLAQGPQVRAVMAVQAIFDSRSSKD